MMMVCQRRVGTSFKQLSHLTQNTHGHTCTTVDFLYVTCWFSEVNTNTLGWISVRKPLAMLKQVPFLVDGHLPSKDNRWASHTSSSYRWTAVCWFRYYVFLPRCMECRHGLAMRFLSVRLSARLSNACIVTKRKKSQSRFLYPAIDNLV